MTFLPHPAAIRRAIHDLFSAKRIDIAVAFIRADWEEILADYKGELRVICWLSSTNTDPYAVEALKKRSHTTVKQRHAMHCKVYLAPLTGCVVGSANLSKAALNESDSAGQDEAAIYVSEQPTLRNIHSWFQEMWDDEETATIKRSDLSRAKAAFDRAQAARKQGTVTFRPRKKQEASVPSLPGNLPSGLRTYVEAVKSINLRNELAGYADYVGSLQPVALTNAEHDKLTKLIVSWAKHPGSYHSFRDAPISKIRKGLELLFDESIELRCRLNTLLERQDLPGLRIPSLSLLLYWRFPRRYPPYNYRTRTFLEDLGMRERGMSEASPGTYATWLRWATRFHQRFGLPTTGHVDRLVSQYYDDHHG